MIKKILFILVVISFQNIYSQKTDDGNNSNANINNDNSNNIETTVITLRLSEPNPQSVKNSSNKNKLVVKNKSPLAFNLIDGNPFRYRYVLNYNKINMFTSETFNPIINGFQENEGMIFADRDGDGIPDNLDEYPETPNEMTEEIANSLQNKLKDDITEFKENIESYIVSISDDDKLNFNEFNKNKKLYKEQYKVFLKRTDDIQVNIDIIRGITSVTIDKQTEIKSILESTRLMIEKLLNTKENSYLLPLDVNGDNIDYVEIKLDIYDGDNETPEVYKYKVWVTGGLKIDVGGGIYLSSLMDKEYYITDAANNQKLIHEKELGDYDFGFGPMVNLSLRGGSWVRPSLNFGTMLTAKQKFQMLAGIGLILGKSERFVLHSGISMGRISVLSDGYKTDGVTSYNLGNDGSIPVNEMFKFGHFFGITYNLNKPKSNND